MPSNTGRRTRSSTRTQRVASDKPKPPAPVDLAIARHNGTSTALEATPERLQASKKESYTSLSQREEELTRENGHLRGEIRYWKDIPTRDLKEDVESLKQGLEDALFKFSRELEKAEDDRNQVLRARESMGRAGWGEDAIVDPLLEG
jgi:hypothetical protein